MHVHEDNQDRYSNDGYEDYDDGPNNQAAAINTAIGDRMQDTAALRSSQNQGAPSELQQHVVSSENYTQDGAMQGCKDLFESETNQSRKSNIRARTPPLMQATTSNPVLVSPYHRPDVQ